MYFDLFPTIEYKNVGLTTTKTVTNILKRAAIRSAIKENRVIFTQYIIKGNETPESLAFDLYDDAELHWVILLSNDIYDRYHQWPMNVNQFLSYVGDKYSNPNGVHHYEISQTSGDTTVKINIGTTNADYPSATAITNIEYEEARQNKLRRIKFLQPNQVATVTNEFASLMKDEYYANR